MERERELILGPFHPVLEEAFFRAVQGLKQEDPLQPVVVLVGSNLLQLYLRRKMALSMAGHINVRFITFMDLASSLDDGELEDSGRLRTSVAVEELFARQVCSRMPEDGYFYPVMHLKGFHRLLRNVFSELRMARVEKDHLIRSARAHDSFSEQKFQQLALLYGLYQERLSHGAYDESDLFWLAAQKAAAFSRLMGADTLLVYGIYDFNAAQRKLLQALFPHLHVRIFLPWEQTRAYRYIDPALSWLEGMGFPLSHADPPVKPGDRNSKFEIRMWGRLSSLPDSGPPQPHITVVAAAGEAGEVREAAREILRHARAGVPFHEMGVLLRNHEPYARLVQEIFDPLGIPYCLIPGTPLSSTYAGRSIRMLLDLMGRPFPRFDVMEFISSAPVPFGSILQCPEDECAPADWDALSMEAGIVQGRDQWIKRLSDMEARYSSPSEEEADDPRVRAERGKQVEMFRRFITIFLEDLDTFPSQASWARWVEASLSLIRRYIILDVDGRGEVLLTIEELAGLDRMFPEATLADFRETVARTLTQKSLRRGLFQRSGVNVCGLMESRGLSFRMVFVPGLADGLFPGPIRPDPILPDAERKALGDILRDPDAMPLQARRPAEEELLFRLAAGAARERLILTYPHMEPVTGRPRHPSAFLLDIDSKFEFRAAPMVEEDADALDEAEFHLARIKDDRDAAIVCLDQLSPIFRAARQAHAARHLTARLTPYEGALPSQEAREILRRRFSPDLESPGLNRGISPTALEEYAQCPFRYYLQHVLALKPLQEPEEVLTFPARERGLLIHRILRDFYRQILNIGEGPLLASRMSDYRRLMSSLVDRWCHWQESIGHTGRAMAWALEQERLQAEMVEFIHEELAQADRFVPRYLEVGFPPRAHEQTYNELDQSTLKLQLDDQTVVALRGRVDRIDLGRDCLSARVVDYKSGERRFKPEYLHGGRQIQLPVYALAARQMLASTGVQDVEAQYYYVGSQGRFRREGLSSHEIGAMEIRLREILALIVEGILSGLFIPAGEEAACPHCRYRAACGPSRGKVLLNKKDDPGLSAFHRLREIRTA